MKQFSILLKTIVSFSLICSLFHCGGILQKMKPKVMISLTKIEPVYLEIDSAFYNEPITKIVFSPFKLADSDSVALTQAVFDGNKQLHFLIPSYYFQCLLGKKINEKLLKNISIVPPELSLIASEYPDDIDKVNSNESLISLMDFYKGKVSNDRVSMIKIYRNQQEKIADNEIVYLEELSKMFDTDYIFTGQVSVCDYCIGDDAHIQPQCEFVCTFGLMKISEKKMLWMTKLKMNGKSLSLLNYSGIQNDYEQLSSHYSSWPINKILYGAVLQASLGFPYYKKTTSKEKKRDPVTNTFTEESYSY